MALSRNLHVQQPAYYWDIREGIDGFSRLFIYSKSNCNICNSTVTEIYILKLTEEAVSEAGEREVEKKQKCIARQTWTAVGQCKHHTKHKMYHYTWMQECESHSRRTVFSCITGSLGTWHGTAKHIEGTHTLLCQKEWKFCDITLYLKYPECQNSLQWTTAVSKKSPIESKPISGLQKIRFYIVFTVLKKKTR